jgi:nucleoside-diphosphate-sugar epimerase
LRISVTGGAGFIGRHFCRRLRPRQSLHSILDIRPTPEPGPDFRQVLGDVRDPDAVRAALEGADAVLHLAAAHHDFGISPDTFFSVNEEGARVLCQGMDEAGIRTVCFFSTVAVYGSEAEHPDESAACRPESPYGESKLAGENVFRDWMQQGDGRSVLIIRPTVTFGPGHFANVYTLIRQIRSRMFVRVGPGRNRKSLVYVDNLVDATLELWSRLEPGQVDICNMVDKPDLTSREISDAVYRALGRRPPRIGIPMWAALLAALPFDLTIALTGRNLPISSARVKKFAQANTRFAAGRLEQAGIRGSVPLDVGLQQMVKWYLDEGANLPLDRSIPSPELSPYQPVTAD